MLGVPTKFLGAAESKKAAQKFLRFHFKKQCPHMYCENVSFISGGQCFLCGSSACQPSRERPDILGAGLPCQPFSAARQKTGQTKKTKEAEAHPLWTVSMRDFARLLQARLPHMFVVEEVEGFVKAMDVLDGLSPAQALKKIVKPLSYGCTALLLDHRVWTHMSRPRVWIIGVHGDSGGQGAANWIASKISAAMDQLEELNKLKKIELRDVVDIESEAEQQRRSKMERAFFYLLSFEHKSKSYSCVFSMCRNAIDEAVVRKHRR